MNKADLIAATAEKTGLSKRDTDTTLSAALEIMAQAMAQEEKIQLVGFGSFEVRQRAARIGRNPHTKEPVNIPASKSPVFKPGKALKDLVSNS